MNCPACGAALPETGTECPGCGADVAWHIQKADGSQYGPLDLETVERCVREARLLPGDTLRLGAAGAFQPAHELLGDRLAAPPPPAEPARRPATTGLRPETRRWLVKACAIAAGACVVLGLLAVIPIVRYLRVAALTGRCESNLIQAHLALFAYTVDYDDRFPPVGDWETRLDPYIHDRQIWICPAYPNEPGYGRNDELASVKRGELRDASRTLTLWDAGASLPGFPPAPGTTSLRHWRRDNYAFADGHVEWVSPRDLGQLQASTTPHASAPSGDSGGPWREGPQGPDGDPFPMEGPDGGPIPIPRLP